MKRNMKLKQFGGKITPELARIYASSVHWHDGKFQNLEQTGMNIRPKNVPGLICEQLTKKERRPGSPLEIASFSKETFEGGDSAVKYIWYGHSAVLLRLAGKNIFVDPMMGPDTSPIAPFRTRRFSDNSMAIIDELPEIDLVLLTHDHYDHLDMASILMLKGKTKNYYVALGVKRHLVAWGINPDMIREFDWWDKVDFSGIEITFAPSRHFSGRGIRDRFKSFWGGWALRSVNESIYFSGDGGYGRHFKEIGEKLGPFGLAFMECGQYNDLWEQLHMMPEQSVQAALEVNAGIAVPVHWGAFTLALHNWEEPADRFAAEAESKGLQATFPHLGRIYGISTLQSAHWWKEF